jgi:hypothetical protein
VRPSRGAPRPLAGAPVARWLLAACALLAGCYDGPDSLEPEPGYPGGLCIEPAGICAQPNWECEGDGRYCVDPADPCRGVYCGEHGVCAIDGDSDRPVCTCEQGYSNYRYRLYCELL